MPGGSWSSICHPPSLRQASLRQYFWAEQGSGPRLCYTAWKTFGRGAKQDEGSLSVRAAKTSASHIPIRLPPSARIECVSRVVLASLSIVCQNGLCALHWDLAASPSASRTLVTASPEFSLAKADAAASGLWQMHESCRAACLTMSRL